MASIAEVITEEFISGRIYTALDDGVDATMNELSDTLDSVLMTISPPYNAAMTAASLIDQVKEGIKEIKHRVFKYVMGLLEMDHLIEALVWAWSKVPKPIRDGIRQVTAKWNEIVAFYDDPTWANFCSIVNIYSMSMSSAVAVMDLAVEYGIVQGPRWVLHAANIAPNAIADVLDEIGAGPLASTLRDSLSLVEGELQLSTERLAAAWSQIKSGDLDLALKSLVISAPGSGVVENLLEGDFSGAASEVVMAPINAISSVGEGIADAGEALWDAIF